MKIHFFRVTVNFFLLLFCLSFAHADDQQLAKVKEQVVSSWGIKITGDTTPLVINIKDITQVKEKEFELLATYGQIGGGQGGLKEALFVLSEKGSRISFTTQSNNKVEAVMISETTFQGTFTNAKGVSREVVMTKSPKEHVVLAKAVIDTKEAGEKSVVMPEKISGRWKNNRTGYGQAFSMEKISVSGTSFSAKFTQWFDSSCVARSIPVTGEMKNGKVIFSFKPPCYDLIAVVTLDFVSSTGTYKFGNGEVVGSYEFN
jgi:hypothetical protein